MMRRLHQGSMLETRERRAGGERVDDWLRHDVPCLLTLSIGFQPYAEGTRMPLKLVVPVIRCSTKLRSPVLTSIRPRPTHDVFQNHSTRCAAYQYLRPMSGASITTPSDRAVRSNKNMQSASATIREAPQGHDKLSLSRAIQEESLDVSGRCRYVSS
jgi:hypothetical protein